MKKIHIELPSFIYELGDLKNEDKTFVSCQHCGHSDVPLLRLYPSHVTLCEVCSHNSSLAFRRFNGDTLPGTVAKIESTASLVIIARLKEGDGPLELREREVLMVARKDEPEAFALPGGKREEGETEEQCALRELFEETGIVTWGAVLEPIYMGLSPRGRLVRTYLARGWTGEPRGEKTDDRAQTTERIIPVEWKAWPPSQYAKGNKSYYKGLEEAFEIRMKLHHAESTLDFPSFRVGKIVDECLKARVDKSTNENDKAKLFEAYKGLMNEDERNIVQIILDTERRKAEEAKAPPRPRRQRTENRQQKEPEPVELPATIDAEFEEADEKDDQSGEFARGPLSKIDQAQSK